jgi:glucuronoarabinoxylan endo-1,4-beta-xylanase
MRRFIYTLFFLSISLSVFDASAQVVATGRLDAQARHQRITGFGGFVCSPQFTYNHMSTTDINKVWGKGSTVGCNIMRLYIPIGRNSWWQSLETAKAAKKMGLIVFASPWGQPSEWKTNGTSNARNNDGTLGYLKKENWPDYAQYLEDYVQYMRSNGVELDAISIQNEPDWQADYAGCLWSASEIAQFVKTYGPSISCKVMAPETLAVSDSYANALNSDDVLAGFDIYGGHQYGGIQSAYKNLGRKGKELWMTEYLINWNEGQSSNRNFDFSKDFFDFFRAINVCMLGDFNAWVHYAAKRYYGMLGDGQMGTSNGVVTKRGYVMAHFARFVTGMTRIDATFGDSGLEGSAYISVTGDSVVVVMANSTSGTVDLTLDIPFYTVNGKSYTTSRSKSFSQATVSIDSETCRPTAQVAAQSVVTLIYVKSRDRQVSDMKGSTTRFDRLDDIKVASVFGTNYKMSGKTKTLDHENPLISDNTTKSNGYLKLESRYDQLVMQVRSVSSTLNYSSAKTTLIYVNSRGSVSSHDYGDLDLSRRENFNLVFDLSPNTLKDGCTGIISLTNNNWSSKLSITFGDVYLAGATNPYYATLSGAYVEDDSYVQDFTSDANCTSLDMTRVWGLPGAFTWMNGNRIVYVADTAVVDNCNVVAGNVCARMVLAADGGDFRPARGFEARQAELTFDVDDFRFVMIPFTAIVPDGVQAFAVDDDMWLNRLDTIPAHTPVIINAKGSVTVRGGGSVEYTLSPLKARFRGTYVGMNLHEGDYVLDCSDGIWGLRRITADELLGPFGVYANLSSKESFIPLHGDVLAVETIVESVSGKDEIYDLTGRRVTGNILPAGIYIRNGKKIVVSYVR